MLQTCERCRRITPHFEEIDNRGVKRLRCMKCATWKQRAAFPVREKNPVPPSSRAHTINKQSRTAENLYTAFTGHEAGERAIVDKPTIPDVLSVIGDIDGVLYTTVRDDVTEKYIHEFKKSSRPLFCVSPDGKNIFMLGGAYEFTERGIVDN